MPTNSNLWQRIEAFDLDGPGDGFSFSARLAHEHGWSSQKVRAAIAEYKRFIYLVCVAAEPLVPSEVVDQVWRLHLADTRSYWTDLCEGTLGRPIHHDLTDESRASHQLNVDADTRSLYAREFGCAPPTEFWSPVAERLATAPSLLEPDPSSAWVAPQRSGFGSILWCAGVALLALMVGSEDAAAAGPTAAVHSDSVAPLLILGGAVALVWLVARGASRGRSPSADPR